MPGIEHDEHEISWYGFTAGLRIGIVTIFLEIRVSEIKATGFAGGY